MHLVYRDSSGFFFIGILPPNARLKQMLKKLNLDGTKEYELAVAASRVSQMLVAFIQGHDHIFSVGAEQGGINKWDDLVLEENNLTRHIQVKRQNTDFSNEPCVRNNITKGVRVGKPKDLSPFDEAIKSLGEWVSANDPITTTNKKLFEVYLPEGSICIKSEIQINVLKNLCENHIRDVTTAVGLGNLQLNDPGVNNCFNWLSTWCDFKDWEHILKALRILKISTGGSRDDLDISTVSNLENVFHSPQDVLTKIKGFICDNSTFTGAITPRHLYTLLKDNLQPEVHPWTQFGMNGMNWEISGNNDTEFANEIERASVIVPSLWDCSTKGILKLVVSEDNDSPLLNKVLHLALHLQGLSHSHILNHAVWRQTMSNKIGNTLGTDRNDCDNLSVTENNSLFTTSEIKVLDSLTKQDAFSAEIDNEIVRKTWEIVSTRLTNLISAMPTADLKTAIDKRWRAWHSELNNDLPETKKLLKIILHPTAEGNEINGELRIGIKTANLIVDGIYLLLVVSVGLSDNHDKWNKIADSYSATPIGLSYWSGAAGEKRKVREIDNQDAILELIGKEPSDILILSKVKSLESEIYNISLANTTTPENSLAQPHRPKLLVTSHPLFQKMISEGKIEPIRKYLIDIIQRNEDSKNASIEKAKS